MPASAAAGVADANEPESVPARPGAYYPALDGLRAIAVLAVFTHHYLGIHTPLIGNWGALGVDCFFVLSGFLITGILYDSRHKAHRFRDFYARRVLRIFPLYYAVWLGILLLWPIRHLQFSAQWLMWPLHLGNWARFVFFNPEDIYHLDIVRRASRGMIVPAVFMGHFWTLCVEEQFYLLWPLLVFLTRSRRVLMVCCLLLVVGDPLLRFAAFQVLPKPWILTEAVWRLTPFRLDGLAFGGLLALALRGPERRWIDRFGRILTAVSALLCASCVALEMYASQSTALETTSRFFTTFGLSAFSLLSGAVVLELIRTKSVAAQALSWTPLRKLGQISYGFYIFHDLPHPLFNTLSPMMGFSGIWPVAAMGFLGTLLLSLLSFHFFERPILRWKRLFSDQAHTAPKLHAGSNIA